MKPPGAIFTFWEGIATTKSSAIRSIPIARQTFHHFYPIQQSSTSITNGSQNSTTILGKVIETLSGGIFKSVRKSPRYYNNLGSRLLSKQHQSSLIERNSRFQQQPQFRNFTTTTRFSGSSIPKTLYSSTRTSFKYPMSVSQKGLGTARNFTSGGPKFYQNLIENVPIGIRTLLNVGDCLEEKKWKKDWRGIRRGMRVNGAGGRMKVNEMERNKGLEREFNRYFNVVGSATATDEVEKVEEEEEGLTLIIYTQPNYNLLLDYFNDDEFNFDTFSYSSTTTSSTTSNSQSRLFQPTPEELLIKLTKLHNEKITSILNNLRTSGVLEDVENLIFEDFKEGKIKILFSKDWERIDVEQALGDYNNNNSMKEYNNNGFYELIGKEISSIEKVYSTCPSSPTTSNYSNHSDLEDEFEHDLITSNFYLPSPSGSIPSINSTSPFNSFTYSEEEEGEENFLLKNGWEEQGLSWDFGTPFPLTSSCSSSRISSSSYSAVETFHSPSFSPTQLVEIEREEDMESIFSDSSDSRLYDLGIRNFLGDLEDVQREIEWRRAGGIRE